MSDTPRTDEEMWTTDYHHELCNVVNTDFAQQLERELSASKAEVAELNSLMVGWKQRATMSETDLEASKAEIHRLKAIPHFHHESYCRKCGELK